MARYIILAQSESSAAALGAWVILLGEPAPTENDQFVVTGEKLDIFARSARLLSKVCSEGEPIIAMVDTVTLSDLNPCKVSGWDAAVAMLILAFPEVRWVFGVFISGAAHGDEKHLNQTHGLASLFQEQFDPLFDPTGLRRWVRQHTLKFPSKLPFLRYAQRGKLACALDDEEAYAYFHAYCAYRFGFSAVPVTTQTLMLEILDNIITANRWRELRLSFEDLFLNYPDRNGEEKWSDLAQRDRHLVALQSSTVMRVFVTTDQSHGRDREAERANHRYRKALKRAGRLGALVYKPIAGIFDLWKAGRIQEKYRLSHGYEPSFEWPPPKRSPRNDPEGDHSAPGPLLLIAKHLIDRSEARLGEVQTVKGAVAGAVLATDALELLESKTPTTALEALALKHRFEVMAECQFYGVQSHFAVRPRIRDIQRELKSIGEYFHSANRSCAIWNAEAMIHGKLIKIFDDNQQFDESLILQARARGVHRRLWFKRNFRLFGDQLRWLNPFYWLAAYTHSLLRSIPVFCGIMLIWLLGLTLAFGRFHSGERVSRPWQMGMQDAVTSFFSVGGPIHESSKGNDTNAPTDSKLNAILENTNGNNSNYVWLICISITVGFFHVGVFISHLYSIASRK